ncbi:MAG: hypothetical protein SNJ62_02040, partial [Chloracidobacterium sp.]
MRALSASTPHEPRLDFHEWKTGTIIVERTGTRRPLFSLRQADQILAHLTWRRRRAGRYVALADGLTLDVTVGRMGYELTIRDDTQGLSRLRINRRRNPHRARMTIELPAGRFLVTLRRDGRQPGDFSLHVRREFYKQDLLELQFERAYLNTHHASPSRRLLTIQVHPVMRWEAVHFHHLVALLVGCVVFVGGHDQFRFDPRVNPYM